MILAIFIYLALQIVLAFIGYKYVTRKITAFFMPPAEGQPSAFGIVTAQLINQAAVAVTMQLKTTFMGIQSGEAKRERKEQAAGIQEMIGAANPLMGAIAGQYPGVIKAALKNPELLQYGLNILAGMNKGKSGANAAPSNGHNSLEIV